MKNITKYILFFAVIILTQSSCDKGFAELNENPLEPTTVKDGAIFNNLVQSLQLGWDRQLFLHNEKLYDVTELAVVTAATFGNTEGGTEEVWSNYYAALKNARELESRFATYEQDPEIPNIAHAQLKILMAYKTFQITDFFGDIPYSEAGRAFGENEILRPKYDDHKEIYKSLIEDLIWAAEILTTSGGSTALDNPFLSYGNFDTFLGNDRTRWTKFANSMLLRYLVRIYDKDPDYVAPIVKSMIDNGASFLGEGGDIVMSPMEQNWENLGVNWSFREHNKIRLGTNIWNFMNDNNGELIDPRALIFFEPNNDGEWVPFPQIPDADTPQSGGSPYSNARDASYENKGAGNIYASVNYYLIRDEVNIPEIIMTSAEVKFLLAEVFMRGIGVQADVFNANFNYQLGMLESLKFWQNIMLNSTIWEMRAPELSIAELFAVTSHPKYDISMVEDIDEQLEMIYSQRWVDAFRQPWEAFSLLRQANKVPREKPQNTFNRFKYPPTESIYNTDNYNAQIQKMGADENDVKLWWMD